MGTWINLTPYEEMLMSAARLMRDGMGFADAAAKATTAAVTVEAEGGALTVGGKIVDWTMKAFKADTAALLDKLRVGKAVSDMAMVEAAVATAEAETALVTAGSTAATLTGGASQVPAASGGLLATAAAHPAAAVAVLVLLGTLAWFVGGALGTLSADPPSAVLGEGPGVKPTQNRDGGVQGGGYLPVAVMADGKARIVSVRPTHAIGQGILLSNSRHGGVHPTNKAQLQILAGSMDRPFRSADEATAALAALLRGPLRKPPLAEGRTAMFGGQSVTVDDYGGSRVDWKVMRERLR